MVILNDFITTLSCPDCLECTLTVNENFTQKKGLSSYLSIECSNCQLSKGSYSSHLFIYLFILYLKLVKLKD